MKGIFLFSYLIIGSFISIVIGQDGSFHQFNPNEPYFAVRNRLNTHLTVFWTREGNYIIIAQDEKKFQFSGVPHPDDPGGPAKCTTWYFDMGGTRFRCGTFDCEPNAPGMRFVARYDDDSGHMVRIDGESEVEVCKFKRAPPLNYG